MLALLFHLIELHITGGDGVHIGLGIPLELASMPTFLAMANGLHDVVPGDLFRWTTRPRNPMAERLSRHLPHEHLTDLMQHSCMSALAHRAMPLPVRAGSRTAPCSPAI